MAQVALAMLIDRIARLAAIEVEMRMLKEEERKRGRGGDDCYHCIERMPMVAFLDALTYGHCQTMQVCTF